MISPKNIGGQAMRRRLALVVFGFLIASLGCVGCSTFATETQKDFFTKDNDHLLVK
jgi:hypothetical protein